MEIKDVENLAELAKIELSEGEKTKILSDMEGILGYVKQISEVSLPAEVGVEEIEVEYSPKNVWREDEVAPREFSREDIISQFPDSQSGFVKVKKIL